jgi:hypothetical protein
MFPSQTPCLERSDWNEDPECCVPSPIPAWADHSDAPGSRGFVTGALSVHRAAIRCAVGR